MGERLSMAEKVIARRIVVDGQLAKIKRLASGLEAGGDLPASYEALGRMIDRLNEVMADLNGKVQG